MEQYFTNLIFPEIRGCPFLNATFWGPNRSCEVASLVGSRAEHPVDGLSQVVPSDAFLCGFVGSGIYIYINTYIYIYTKMLNVLPIYLHLNSFGGKCS